jgi:hypothetical protein
VQYNPVNPSVNKNKKISVGLAWKSSSLRTRQRAIAQQP